MSWLSSIRRKASSMGAKSPEPVNSTAAIAATTPNPPLTRPKLDDLQAKLPDLRIAIIGAGIGGLAAAVALKKAGFKSVTLYEQSRTIEEVGAGIQVAPNESRLLRRWGCLEELSKSAVPLLGNSIRRYADDKEVGTSKFMPMVEESYGAPLWVVHRADLQGCLLNAAKRLGADIRTNARVVEVDVGTQDTDDVLRTDTVQVPRFKVQNRDDAEGTWVEADIIIAADGIRSKTRKAMMDRQGAKDESVDTGDAAYRITIPRSKFEEKDPDLMKIIDDARGLRWMGPGGHIMAYPIRAQQIYNVVLIHPSRSDVVESWTSTGPRKHMDDFYSSWSPTVRRLLALCEDDEIPEWNLRIHKPLKTWVEGSVALMGDACHPTLPYVAQGAAQAVEDAGVLAVVLSLCAKKEHINPSLLAYMEVRKARAEAVVASASKTRIVLHLPDGPEQVNRDDRIGRASIGESVNPDLWGDKYFQRWVWGTDIQQQAMDRYDDLITEAMARKAIFSRELNDGLGQRPI